MASGNYRRQVKALKFGKPRFIEAGGSSLDNPTMRTVAAQIDNVLACYDSLQRCLGRLDGAPARHERFLRGQ